MLELTRHGLSYRWSALNAGERRSLLFGMGFFMLAGFITGFLAGFTAQREIEAQLMVPLSLLPLVPMAAGVVYLRRFSRSQDELHRKIDLQAAHLAAQLFLLLATPLALLDGLAGVVLLPGWAYVLLFYACLMVGVTVVARRLVGPEEA